MKLLNVIFSYNRYYLFKNTVESCLEFGPEGDLLIVDDGSDDVRIIEYLKELKDRKINVIIRDKHLNGFHGKLYDNMDLATDYAIKNNYKYIFYIQDDMQFMWKDNSFITKVETIFNNNKNVSMISPLFQKGILSDKFNEHFEIISECNCWCRRLYAICDIGIMSVDLLKEKKWKFKKSETENCNTWYNWGYKLYIIKPPILSWIPWSGIEWILTGAIKNMSPKNRYLLKPFTNEQIDILTNSDLKDIPTHEKYCFPWGWKCLSPYWFTGGRRDYIKLTMKKFFKKGILPKISTIR